MKKLGVITGLVREAECLGGGEGIEIRTGFGPERAAITARMLLEEGCDALLSFGICGGIGPGLKAGNLVLPESVVVAAGRRVQLDRQWRGRLLAKLDGVSVAGGALVGSDQMVCTLDDKRRLYEDTGAIAVDMESHSIAEECSKAGVPLLVVRTVSDPADGMVPKSALGSVDEQGRAQMMKVVLALLRRPWDIAGLLRLKRDSDAALNALRRVALLAGPGFGFSD